MNGEYQQSPEEYDEDGLTPEQREAANSQLTRPEFQTKQPLPESERIDCEKGVMEFQGLVNSFEANHPLDQLIAITYLTQDDAPLHPVREPARQDLIPLYSLLQELRLTTNISADRHKELDLEYQRLSNAVGRVDSNDKLQH